MPLIVLIVGAAGKVGSATLQACLDKQHIVTAFVRTLSKLPASVHNHLNVHIFRGDATSQSSLVEGMKGQDAVIQTAVYGSFTPWGSSDSERVVEAVVRAVQEVQQDKPWKRIRLWVLSGEVLMDLPGQKGWILGDCVPVHPEHYRTYAFLREYAGDVEWGLLCPGRIQEGEPTGPSVVAVDRPGLWEEPGTIGKLPVVGTALNVLYNLFCQSLTIKSIGIFLANSLICDEALIGKRVSILEDVSARS